VPTIAYTPEDPKERERSGRESRRLWYRPPEILLREERYSFEVDVWAIGCIIAELCLGEPLFNGDSEIEQLFKIFKLIGSPEEEMYPEYTSVFPRWEPINFPYVFKQKSSAQFKELSKKMIPARE